MDNSSHVGNEPCSPAVSIVFTTVLAIISLAAFIGNILVMTVVYKTPSLRTSTNYYYVNMAVSDFLSSLTLWPLYLTDEIITQRGSLIKGPMATVGCKVGVYVRVFSTSVSILSLVLIATDRYFAIVFSLKSSILLSRRVRITALVATLDAFIGNILVMTVVYKTPSLRTSTNYYYVNMTVSDFLSSLTLWPLYLTDEIITQRGSLIKGPVATVGCKVGVYVRVVSTSVYILSLVLIATDRYFA
ncbi:unnamed protein product, partial [Porites lobata]